MREESRGQKPRKKRPNGANQRPSNKSNGGKRPRPAGKGSNGARKRPSKNNRPQRVHQSINQNVIIQQDRGNSVGTAGFILSIISLFTSLIPFAGWIIWFLGGLLSFIGLFRRPRGLAIAGVIVSFIGFLILFLFIGAIGAFLSSL